MKIVIKTNVDCKIEDVINIFYGENESYINEWIVKYFEQEILRLTNENGDADFFVELSESIFYLVKKYKKVSKGYIYNSTEKIDEKIQSIRLLDFDSSKQLAINASTNNLWNDINNEINHRIMKQIDHESLYQINMKFEGAIKTKNNWNSTELVMLQNEITKQHKKELYSSIVKKVKKFNKKNSKLQKQEFLVLPSKTIIINENGYMEGDNKMPNLSKFSSCSLEYQIINKKEKFD
jgi:hypothetical protein